MEWSHFEFGLTVRKLQLIEYLARVVFASVASFGRSGKTADFSQNPYSRIHRRHVCGRELRFDTHVRGVSFRPILSPPKRIGPKHGINVWVQCDRDAGTGETNACNFQRERDLCGYEKPVTLTAGQPTFANRCDMGTWRRGP